MNSLVKRKGTQMKKMLMCLCLVAIVGCAERAPEGNPEAETAAVAAAKTWLSLVDGEKYAESWEEAAQVFKGAIQKEQWVQTMESIRTPIGKNISRELTSKRYYTSLPGAPDGQYVVIQFDASFAHKKTTVETTTPMLDEDGMWRVSGYFMK